MTFKPKSKWEVFLIKVKLFPSSYSKWIREKLGWYDWTFNFPLIQRIAARTIGLDLVAVQPLAAPVATLRYLDYYYNLPINTDPINLDASTNVQT